MPRYRTKPVEVDAYQWLPADPVATGTLIGVLMTQAVHHRCVVSTGASTVLAIDTAEGEQTAHPSDWVICKPSGDWAVVPAAEFAARFEPVVESGPVAL